MMDAPTFGEVLEVSAGERGSAVGPEADRDTDFSEVAAKHPNHSDGCGILVARDDYEPTRESVRDY